MFCCSLVCLSFNFLTVFFTIQEITKRFVYRLWSTSKTLTIAKMMNATIQKSWKELVCNKSIFQTITSILLKVLYVFCFQSNWILMKNHNYSICWCMGSSSCSWDRKVISNKKFRKLCQSEIYGVFLKKEEFFNDLRLSNSHKTVLRAPVLHSVEFQKVKKTEEIVER